jgi:hypothetical protein
MKKGQKALGRVDLCCMFLQLRVGYLGQAGAAPQRLRSIVILCESADNAE